MVILHPDPRPLTCMLIDMGRFQWTWLPMGTVVASDVFQKKLDEIFHNVPGVPGIADDMVIYGKLIKEHDKHLLNFLSIVRKNNMKLNASKLQFQLEEVSFFGLNWSSKGISPEPKKIQAIQQMVFPPDKELMQSFLGMVNFLNRYSPRLLSDNCVDYMLTINLNWNITNPSIPWRRNFPNKIVLPYYDSASHTTLQTDSSKKILELYSYKMELLSVLPAEPSPLQIQTIRALTARHWEQYRIWKNSIISYMVISLH